MIARGDYGRFAGRDDAEIDWVRMGAVGIVAGFAAGDGVNRTAASFGIADHAAAFSSCASLSEARANVSIRKLEEPASSSERRFPLPSNFLLSVLGLTLRVWQYA